MQDSAGESEGWSSATAVGVDSTKEGPIPQSFPVPTLFGLANSIVASAWREWLVGTSFEWRPVLESLRYQPHHAAERRLSLRHQHGQ